jgi:hypothetical protein
MEARMTSATEVWASPEWYPVAIDRVSRRIQFVRMSPHMYRASVFLDSRTCHLGETCAVGVGDLLRARSRDPAEAVPVHYIFHTAFCCSTLLARYLESLSHVLVLKEPGLLSHVAVARYDSQDAWQETATLTLALLSRTYAANQAISIKASDWCNSIAEFALAANPAATGTFQMVPLRRFVLAVLKSARRRRWAHARARLARRDAGQTAGLTNVAGATFTDGQAAAFIWLVNVSSCRRLKEGVYSSRVGLLDGEELAARPGPCLKRVIAGSCLHRADADLSCLAESFASQTYSKGQGREFDVNTRSSELGQLNDTWGREADAAVSWAMGIDPQNCTDLFDSFALRTWYNTTARAWSGLLHSTVRQIEDSRG